MRSLINFAILYFLILSVPQVAYGNNNPLVLNDFENRYPVAGYSRFLRDQADDITFEKFIELDKTKLPVSNPEGKVFGTSDKWYWFYTELENQSKISAWHLGIEYFGNGAAKIWLREKGGNWKQISNLYRNIDRHFYQNLRLRQGVGYELVINAISPGPDKFAISIMNDQGKASFIEADNRWLGIFYGGLTTLILYNMFVAISIRSRAYGAYVIYLLSILAFLFTLDGFGQLYLWGDNEEWSRSSYYAILGIFVACGCQFSRFFLETRSFYPKIDHVLKALIVCGILLTIFEVLMTSRPIFTNFAILLAIVYAVVIFVSGVVCYLKGNRIARYFLLAWIFPVIGVIYTAFMYAGFVPFNSIGFNVIHTATLIEAILLSMALADRINIFQEEREAAVNAAKDRLEDSNRELARANEMKNTFLATISHELRTPMNGIMAAIPMLKDHIKDIDGADLLANMEHSSDNMLSMVDRILNFSEIQAGTAKEKKRVVELKSWLDACGETWKEQCARKSVDWQCTLNIDENVKANVDTDKVRRVVNELVNNAIKFTPMGSVSLNVSLNGDNEQHVLKFIVQDTGIGIPHNRRLEVFSAFSQVQYRFDRQYGGLGIGLALAREIASLLNGKLNILDTEKGTKICFEVPVSIIDQPAVSTESEKRDNSKAIESLNVLIVEDNHVNQMIMKKILAALGHRFMVAEDGEQAVEMARCETFDLILMDCQMPNMDGFEATRLIRSDLSRNQKTPIIAITANAMEGDRERCLDAGMNDYLKKPIKPAMIDKTIHRWAS